MKNITIEYDNGSIECFDGKYILGLADCGQPSGCEMKPGTVTQAVYDWVALGYGFCAHSYEMKFKAQNGEFFVDDMLTTESNFWTEFDICVFSFEGGE